MPFKKTLSNKYTQIEVLFFICYFLLFRILTTVEYNFYETSYNPLNIQAEIVYGIKAIIPAWICYKTLIQRLLFRKKYLRFFLFYVLYLLLLKLYDLGSFWIISNLNFVSADIQQDARTYFLTNISSNRYHFASVYMFRELILLSALAYFIRSSKLDKKIAEMQKEKLQSELKYLKVQLQPHFFFNTLNNIYALTLQKSAEAAALVAKHADMMRYILYESSSPSVSLKKELLFLQNYVEVERVRYSEKIDILFETQGIHDGVQMEPLLLLPLIENTFKHGLREETDTGYIHIIMSLVNTVLSVEIENSKPQRLSHVAMPLSNKTAGIGVQNMIRRLDMLYPKNYTIDIAEDVSRYEVRLTINMNSDD